MTVVSSTELLTDWVSSHGVRDSGGGPVTFIAGSSPTIEVSARLGVGGMMLVMGGIICGVTG